MRTEQDQVLEFRQPRGLLIELRPLLAAGGRVSDRTLQLIVGGLDHQQHQLAGLEDRLRLR